MARRLVHGLLAVCTTALCAASEPGTSQLIARADSALARRDFAGAVQLYAQAFSADPASYDAAWKLARACNDAGEAASRARERRALFARAQSASASAIRLNPDGAWGHFHRGLALGRAAMDTSIGERMRVAKEVRVEFERAVALDSTIVDGWDALGHWHRTMATLGWFERSFCDAFLGGVPKDAGVSTAAACFERAVALEPQSLDHHLQLGMTREMLGNKDAARREYQRVLDLPGAGAVDERKKSEAKKRLSGLR
jgi:tetratricopeptide (TPR) repeat protein